MFDKAEIIIKDVYMKFYDETKPLYTETGASGVGLRAALLQTRSNTHCHRDEASDNSIFRPIAFINKTITRAEKSYNNIEREVLGILYGLEKFHHHCFVREVNISMGHKPLITNFKKDVTTLSQRLQQLLLRIHQYRVRIM